MGWELIPTLRCFSRGWKENCGDGGEGIYWRKRKAGRYAEVGLFIWVIYPQLITTFTSNG
jgi:hypothetical protein